GGRVRAETGPRTTEETSPSTPKPPADCALSRTPLGRGAVTTPRDPCSTEDTGRPFCTVLIAAADLLPALKERGFEEGGELLAFPDSDALGALDVISRRQPDVVALEQTFAATPRGAALINRIKADPTLSGSTIRI